MASPESRQKQSINSFLNVEKDIQTNYFNLQTKSSHQYADSLPDSPVESKKSLMTYSEKKLLALNQIVDQSMQKAKAK